MVRATLSTLMRADVTSLHSLPTHKYHSSQLALPSSEWQTSRADATTVVVVAVAGVDSTRGSDSEVRDPLKATPQCFQAQHV